MICFFCFKFISEYIFFLTDFVTPLKKRRLARESLSQDQLPFSAPSTPSPSLMVTVPPDFSAVGPSNSVSAASSSTSSLSASFTTQCFSGMEELRSRNGLVGTRASHTSKKIVDKVSYSFFT